MITEENKEKKQQEITRLYEQYHAEMCELALSILHDEEEAKDVVSDIFTWLVDHFAEEKSVQWHKYLLTSVRHRCQDIIKHRHVQQRAQSSLMMENIEEQSMEEQKQPDAIDIINYAERNMTPKTKKIFLLRYGENMTYREISKELGISIPAVYKHILQARHKITARFVGILLALTMMVIAVAMGIKWYQQRQTPSTVSSPLHSSTIIQEEDRLSVTPSVMVFENEKLAFIIQQIATYYQVRVNIRDQKIGNLRLYFKWNQNERLEQVVNRLNHFHRFHIRIEQNDQLIIE